MITNKANREAFEPEQAQTGSFHSSTKLCFRLSSPILISGSRF